MNPVSRAKTDPIYAVQLGMGGVFLGAGLFRILRFDLATKEMAAFGMPPELAWVLIVLEVVAGIFIIADFLADKALILMSGLMVSAFYMAIKTKPEVVQEFPELFVFDSTATDIWLHMIYLFVMIGLIQMIEKKRIENKDTESEKSLRQRSETSETSDIDR